MVPADPSAVPPVTPPIDHPLEAPLPPMPRIWRLALLACVVGLTVVAYQTQPQIGPKGQAAIGIVAFFLLGAAFSRNLRAVNWRTIGWGIALQAVLALLVIQGKWRTERPDIENGQPVTVITEYSVYGFFDHVGEVVKKFIGFSNEGSKFVFGNLYDARPPEAGGTWSRLFNQDYMFQFAFVALPPILFVSAFFTVLYHFGVLQWIVRFFARIMVYLLLRQRVHGPDRSAVDRQALRAANDEFGAIHFDGERHGPHFRRHDGRVHQLRRQSRRHHHNLHHGLPVQHLPGEVDLAGDGSAGDGRHLAQG
jgi:CNT family concentrative nucleoside transporter